MKAIYGALLALALAQPLRALDPLPDLYTGPGYLSWQVKQEAKIWRMEDVLERLRSQDQALRQKTMKELGLEKIRVGRNLVWPEVIQPIQVELRWLGIERRKEAVLTMPVKGKHAWVLVLLRQDSNDEAYWRPFQIMKFDAMPEAGIAVDFPDINGEEIYFVRVQHLVKDDIYGDRKVDSIFKYDEKQLRLCYQETADFYRQGQHQGDAVRMRRELVFKGDQRIVRKVEARVYPYMPGPEFYKYEEENVKPRKTFKFSETFSWTPQNFSFYDPAAELEKLALNKSAVVRRDAARRLGEILKTTHSQLEKALIKDKDAYVRAQCALALENIGDTKALPALQKALQKYNDTDNAEGAYQRAFDKLSALKAKPEVSN